MKKTLITLVAVTMIGATLTVASVTVTGGMGGTFSIKETWVGDILWFAGAATCYVNGNAVDPDTKWTEDIESTEDEVKEWWWWSGTYSVSGSSSHEHKNEKGEVDGSWSSGDMSWSATLE